MPGLIRKLLIYGSINGLIVQSHGPVDHHKAIQISYDTSKITAYSGDDELQSKRDATLEAHGLIGLISIASSSFLIAITKREQVAQIFGKPVYVVTDVAFLPLSSHNEADRAIKAINETQRSAEGSADSDFSDSDVDETATTQTSHERASSVTEDDPAPLQSSFSTSIAQDVFAKRGQFGRFASQWLSRQGWATGKNAGSPTATISSKPSTKFGDDEKGVGKSSGTTDAVPPMTTDVGPEKPAATPVTSMLPKILRTSRLILSSRSFFFSYEFDLTTRMSLLKGIAEAPTKTSLDSTYFWNRKLGSHLSDSGQGDGFVLPIMQGFVGQRSFAVRKPSQTEPDASCVVSLDADAPSDGLSHAAAHAMEGLKQDDTAQEYLLTIISRRSTKRSGLRYLRRGIDDEGNCANTVETEQILSSPQWHRSRPLRSFIQVRASIPLYFSQTPYAFKPVPSMHNSAASNRSALKRHFNDLQSRYGGIQVALLVDKHGNEVVIGEKYEKNVQELTDGKEVRDVEFEWFDFHAECKGMKFENVNRLVDKLSSRIDQYGETVLINGLVESYQKGIIRTNCMDCLDRTNVAESAFGQYVLQEALAKEGYVIDLVHDETTTWFNTLWADNGDAISRQYAGTAALKGDFTRTRKRNYQGMAHDFTLTLTRYYNNMVNDFFSQTCIDVLLGNLNWKAFEDFENNMMSKDPGVSMDNVRQYAIETAMKVVIQNHTEDAIHGWTMLAPAHENTLRTLPFQEVVVLLTDAALYCCKFDWTTEKVASFEKVDLRSISKIRYGTYITSTFTDRQMDKVMNVGLVIAYKPGGENVIRTNTRSLSNAAPLDRVHEDRIDGGTGVLSWLAPRQQQTNHTLAVKVIPSTSDSEDGNGKITMPLQVAESICDEVKRAMIGSNDKSDPQLSGLIEQGDIISLEEAKKRTGYIEQLGHSIRKLVWT